MQRRALLFASMVLLTPTAYGDGNLTQFLSTLKPQPKGLVPVAVSAIAEASNRPVSNHLSIVGGHAAKGSELPSVHEGLFDRLPVAQAR